MKNDQENDRGDVSESWSEPIYFTFRVSESATLSAKGKQLWRRMTGRDWRASGIGPAAFVALSRGAHAEGTVDLDVRSQDTDRIRTL